MKKSKFGTRVIAFVLVMIMVASLMPLSAFAVNKFDVVTDRNVTYTGIDNSSLNQNGTINWPIKIYDYLADGILFEFAQADGSVMYSSNKVNTDDYTGQYVLGKPMPPTSVGHDFTTDWVYTGQQVNTGYATEKNRYKKTKMAAVDYQSPQYMRITSTGGTYLSNFSSDMNCCITNFTNDNGGVKAKNDVRYMAMVYRSNGIANSGSVPGFAINVVNSSGSWLRFPSNDANLYDTSGKTISNTSEWKVFVCDLATLNANNWNSIGTSISSVYLRLVMDSTSDYFDISHIGYFSNVELAKQYGEQCLAFIKDPGEYIPGTYWNGAGNDAFGMLYPSNGAAWNSGGGNPVTTTTGGQYAGYYTQGIGAVPSKYESAWTFGKNINANRKDGVDANGRLNGTGNLIGTSDMIYLLQPKTFLNVTGGTEYDMSELQFDGYNLLTKSTKGVFTAGLLEGTLSSDGTPQYRQETIEYIADLLSKTLVIPRTASNGYNNYNFVAGVKNREQYGYSVVNGKEVANDLAQGLRNCLDIYFSGNNKAAAPKMGTYAETLQKADKLKGKFLSAAPYIDTCIDAAYYLLNNIFVADSYNQAQNDYRYLTLSSATLSNGQTAYVFDGGFSNGASLDNVANGSMTQEQYKNLSDSAIEYSSIKEGGDGTISLNKVDEKDYFYYQANTTAYTTMYPFLPVTGATGVYAGGTDSYYFAEDGKRSYTDEFGTYKNRNYNYVLASNGEFVYHEEDSLFFEFEGDDDVYLFINGQLVLDLGGGHSVASSSLNVNDYVTWARTVLKNPENYTAEEIKRANALDLTNGEIVSFDFYYMERHGYGANMRIATNMHITDPALRVDKTAYQGGKQIEYGGIVDGDSPIEYNFTISNVGNTKLYNMTFDDSDIGLTLTPEKGLFVKGDDTTSIDDDINGYIVTDAHGGRLDAGDLTAVVTGYQQVGSGGDYIQEGHTYTKVEAGTGTHIYYDSITINFEDNEALKNFLKTLQSDKTDNNTVDDERTQEGSGLWVDSSVTFKGIYYTMTDDQESAGMFDNTVYVTATTKSNVNDPSCESLRSEARHRVYVTAIPSYYQWAGHELFISKKKVLDDSSAEAGNESSMLHDYQAFFNKVNGDTSKFGTAFCDRLGNKVNDSYYEHVKIEQAADGNWGYMARYPEAGIYEFFLLMYMYGTTGEVSTMNLGDYAVVRVLVIVADVEDSEYVLDYGLSTENLDVGGELFKNDELYGALSGTQAKVMGFTTTEPYYLNPMYATNYNRIHFLAQDISTNNKFITEDGYYTANMVIPDEGKTINYNEFSNMYTLTETGTTTINVDCPVSWENLYLYYWYDDGRNNAWPGQKMNMISHGNFELNIPSNVPHIVLSNGTNQTVDLHLNTGAEAWVDIKGTLNDEGKLYASVSYKTADGIVHVAVPAGWDDVYYHCWDATGNPIAAWPGIKAETVDEDGFYTFHIPSDITNIVINNGSKKQTKDQVLYAGTESWLTVKDFVEETNPESGVTYYEAVTAYCHPDETVTMHAAIPAYWEGAALYYWYSNGSSTGLYWPGIPMTKGEDGLYHVEGIPADVTNVIINNGNENRIEQTHNLSISAGIETWFNVTAKAGDEQTKVEVNVPKSWDQTYVYFFFRDSQGHTHSIGEPFPGTAATKVSDGVFTIDAPDDARSYVISNGNGIQSQDLGLILGATNKVAIETDRNARPLTETELHIETKNTWANANVYYWYKDANGNDVQGSSWPGEAAEKNEDGTFSFVLPAGYNRFIINDGNGNQTANISEFYMGIENHVTINNDNTSHKIGLPYETDIVYGANAEKEGFTFTPTDFMDSFYSIWMAITVHETDINTSSRPTALGNAINIAKEVQMYKKITVLPANVVYYEDDFAGIKYNKDTTANTFEYFGDGSGSLTQSIDQNQQYGQDATYQGDGNDEITGGSMTKVEIKDNQEFASFEFTGTGFEIIGHTHAKEPASLRVVVKDENGNIVGEKIVVTEFDNGADGGSEGIVAVPLIRFSGLAFGKYTVSLNGVPVYDWSQWDGDRNHKPPVKKACVCLDGVRIYQPLDSSTDGSENVALGKKYDFKAYTSSPYTANLTDGKAATNLQSGVNDSSWFGFKNTGDSATGNIDPNNSNRAVGVLDLGQVCDVDKVRVHHFRGTNSVGAGTFDYINVYLSEDGNTYNYIQSINPDSTQEGAYWGELDVVATKGAPVKARYVKFAIGATAGRLILINEIEVIGKGAPEAGKNDAYLETENEASFTEIRNLIARRQAFAVKYDDTEGLSVSGGTNTWIENRNNVVPGDRDKSWKNNTVNSVSDYLLAGPNNEVYMIESTEKEKSALVFYVQESGYSVHNFQIAIRALDHGTYMGSPETGYLYADIQYGAMVDGELVWKPLTVVESAAEQYFTVPYTECPYDEVNNRYQVVLRVADSDITGLASYTTVKLNGLDLLTLNTDEVPDVPEITYKDEINNVLIDSNGNTLDISKFVDFIQLDAQMETEVVVYDLRNDQPAPEGVNTSALGALYHNFTADSSTDFVLTEDSKIYIVTTSESAKPSAETIETAQLVQSQFAADKLPSAEPMEVVWGLEKYTQPGDILIFANASGYSAEKYKLVVADQAKVYASDDNGLLYGLNTLQKHFRYAKTNAIEGFTVEDYPQTAERTIHLDVARKYLTKDWVVNYIKEMSWMGYNALELHFSEDGGFRADFWDPNYFVSANGNDFSWTVGSRTQYWVNDPYKTDPDAGKYLTAAELVEICETALQYNIEIIPSFDTPAHVDWLTWNHYNNYSAKGKTNTFKYNGTTYTLPTYINYRTSSTSDSRWACLNLGNDAVQKFALAMYKDIADFFTQYAGSTKFNIGGDEVALTTSDTWNYATFYNYINTLNSMLNSEGYTVRMYNDFLDRSKYINQLPSGTTMPTLASNIEIVYWTADGEVQPASNFENQNRKVYNGMNYWTYYVLRIADASSVSAANKGRDARDPNNTWWSFYRNQEDYIYGEWNPTLFSGYNASTKYTIWDDTLAGGYFMVWNDYAALNTEVEMWNGVYDKTGVSGTSNNFYSLINRMWSSAIKQWHWGIHNSSYNGVQTTYAKYALLRDTLGFFPGYVATTSGSYAKASADFTEPLTTVSDLAFRNAYTVTFKNYNGEVLNTQEVREGSAAVAPADPTKKSDVWYDYTFAGWDRDFTNVTSDIVVTATYTAKATTAGKLGYLGLKVSGGTNVNVSFDDAVAKPMGIEYVNASMEFGVKVTVSAETTNSNRFIGWVDSKSGEIVTTNRRYTFHTSGNDILLAVFDTDVMNKNLVIFRNDKTNQVVDMQYYSATDTITIPTITYPGYEFMGWQYTEAEIKEQLAQGKDVTVYPVWTVKDVYFDITVNGGSVTYTEGMDGDKYIGYKGTVVTLGDTEPGQYFAYWADEEGNVLSYDREFKFYPYRDMEITAHYITATDYKLDVSGTMTETLVNDKQGETFTVYFENNWKWSDVCAYYWGITGEPQWPGISMTLVETNASGNDIYMAEIPYGVKGVVINGIKNDGSGNRDQTPDIKEYVDGRQYSMNWNYGNEVVINDYRINGSTQFNVVYLRVSADWASENAWFATYAWNGDNDSNNAWFRMAHVSGDIYVVYMPVELDHLICVRMNPASNAFSWDNKWNQTGDLTVTPDDTDNLYALNAGFDNPSGYTENMNTVYFVNEQNWSKIDVSYTDDRGTYKSEAVYAGKDKNGNEVYSMLIPTFATSITFSDGTNEYVYLVSGGKLQRDIVFTLSALVPEVDREALINVGMDTSSVKDSNTIVFSWDVSEETGYTFINAGVLIVKEENYNESTFVKGTIDPNVIQFVPSKNYLNTSGIHSVTIPQVAKGDGWIACAFVQYRDENGILRTKYSKQVTGTK